MNKYLYYSGKYLQPGRVNTAALAYVFRKVLSQQVEGAGYYRQLSNF